MRLYMPGRAARVETWWGVYLPEGAELRRAIRADVDRVVYAFTWRGPVVAANNVLLGDEPPPIQRKAKIFWP